MTHHPHNMCGASTQDVRGIRTSCAKRSIPFIRFFQNMEWNTNALNCKAHGGSTRTELNMKSRRCWRYKGRKRCSVQLPDNFWDKYFEKKVSNITGKQPPLLYAQQCLRAYQRCVFNNPPYSPFLCVTFRYSPKLRRHPYHFKFLKNQLLDHNTYHLLSLYDLGLIIVN